MERTAIRTGADGPIERPRLLRTLAALTLFGVSFGFVEAAIVVYLRALYEPIHRRVYPDAAPDALFPILLPQDLEAVGPTRGLAIELVREAATLVMLAAVGLAAARDFRQWLAGFLFAFGVWDVFFYVSLKAVLGWPESLGTWDLLFLLPVPWVGPVLAPLLVALTMIATGATVLGREAAGRPVQLRWGHWLAIGGGGLVLVIAFCWDWRNVLSRGEPGPFNWPLFVAGLGVALAAFLHAVWGGPALAASAAPAGAGTGP
jgi:hypothetical protein